MLPTADELLYLIIAMSINFEELKRVNVEILSSKEKQKCYEAFVAFDKNASGYIEKDELRKVLEGKFSSITQRDGTKAHRRGTHQNDQ